MPGNTEVSSRELIPLMKSLILTIIQKELLTKNGWSFTACYIVLHFIIISYYLFVNFTE